MKIRSITYFFNPGWPPDETKMKAAGAFLAEAQKAFEELDYEVQTTRLATTSFAGLPGMQIKETPDLAEAMEAWLPDIGVDYASLGPAFPDLPGYPQGEAGVKVPAGWLIEQLGFKGVRRGDAGVHRNQALVLVNYGSASGQEILALANEIRQAVRERFSIEIEPEVNIL